MPKDKNRGDDKSLKLRLIAWDDVSKDEVTKAGHIVSAFNDSINTIMLSHIATHYIHQQRTQARLDLTLKSKKSWNSVVQHLVKKWTGIADIGLRLQIFATGRNNGLACLIS